MMRTLQHNLRGQIGRVTGLAILLTLSLSMMVVAREQSGAPLPRVIEAGVPIYPRALQLAHIEGTVRLRISTDGRRVASVDVQSGQPMLARAAQANMQTWKFEGHSPTNFEVIFRYNLLHSTCDAECNCSSIEKPSIVLQLPTEVAVNAPELMVCDSHTH